jgi:flagellar basal body-associated protein FliL
MFLVAILGFVAAVKKLKRLMVFYVVMIFVILTVQMAMGIVMLTMDSSDVYDTFREDSVEGYQRRENFQTYMECCGWDYSTEEFFPERVACVARHPTYTNTCKEEVQDVIDTWVTPTGIVLVVLSVLALIALVAALVVIFSQRKKKEDFFENPFSF